MKFQLHTQFPTDLEEKWNALLAESIHHVPFLRYEYLRNWWNTRGGGEWDASSRLALVTATEKDQLVGIAPLFHNTCEDNPSLLFLGAVEISDYLDFIVRPADLSPFLEGLLRFLKYDPKIPVWRSLVLHNLLESSPTLAHFNSMSTDGNWRIESAVSDHAPRIALPGDWETYLAGLDKKQRHEIRRKMRRLEEAEKSSRWYFVKDEDNLEEAITDFLELMAYDPQKALFLKPEMKTTMWATIRSAFKNGYLQLAFLEIDGEKAAGYLNFDYLNHLWIYNSGMNPKFLTASPGWVLLGYLLRWANENQRESFDFMRGNEDYKYRFGANDRFVYRLTVQPANS
jgi:hypothetical protein